MQELKINKKSKLFALYIDASVTEIPQECDIVALRVNQETNLEKILSKINKPLMICSTEKDDVNADFLPELIKKIDRECIISFVTEKNYKKILPSIIEGGHYVVLKTPIDINLAKELNILAIEMGVPKNKIIMNTDIGGLGYGYEYGYSLIEKILCEKNDEYLDFPIITEAASESLKTKEAKISDKMAKMIELSAVSGAIAAGANIFTVNFTENIKVLKELI